MWVTFKWTYYFNGLGKVFCEIKMSISGAALEQVMSICCVGYDTAHDKYHYIDTKLRNFQAQRRI